MPNNDTPLPDMNLVSYRLKEIESNLDKHLEKLSDKIDLLLNELNQTAISQSETKIKVSKLESEVETLKRSDSKTKEEITSLKVSIAEKLSWGAVGGVISGVIIKVIEMNGG
jgi:predicted RNase H-like nuclease (RuvC/YqgF family)